MVEELNIRQIGLTRTGACPTCSSTSAKVYKPRLEGEQNRDPLDTFIDKMEGIRPECPVRTVEETWDKITKWFVDITPPIKILPPKEEAGLEAALGYEALGAKAPYVVGLFDPWTYDTSENCYIEIGELLVAIDDYLAGRIVISDLLKLITLYTGHTRNPVCPPGVLWEFIRGTETVKATLTVTNTGAIAAKNVHGSVLIKKPDGSTWATVSFPASDIAPGASKSAYMTKMPALTDPIGTYTNSGTIEADNAPSVSITGNAFKVIGVPAPPPPIETTIAATMGYAKA